MSSNTPFYAVNNCFFNASINRQRAFAHLNLRQVFGSLGLNGWFEFGGENYTLADFIANPSDSHSWLEDSEGNIYDYCFKEYLEVVAIRNLVCGSKMRVGELRKVSPADAKARGLTYVPAPKNAQDYLIERKLMGRLALPPLKLMDAIKQQAAWGLTNIVQCDPVVAVEWVDDEDDKPSGIVVVASKKRKGRK